MKFTNSYNVISNDIFARKIRPEPAVGNGKQYSFTKNYSSQSFQMLFKLSSWLGFLYSKPSDKKLSNCLCTWDSMMFLSVIISFMFTAWGAMSCEISERLVGCFLCYESIGIFIRVALLLKKKKMFSVVSTVFRWLEDSNVYAQKHFTLIKIQVHCFISGVIGIAVFMVFFSPRLAPMGKKYWEKVGNEMDDHTMSFLTYFIRFCVIYNTVMTYATTSLAVLCCANLYLRAGYMLQTLRDDFKEDTTLKKLSRSTVICVINEYRRMIRAFRDIDSIISDCCILVYAAAVSSVFGTVSVYFTNFEKDTLMISYTVIANAGNLMMFYAVTLTGANASSQSENLKISIMDGFESILVCQDNQLLSLYKLLIDTISNNCVYFTGFSMFRIDLGLILSTSGALLTYGMILFS